MKTETKRAQAKAATRAKAIEAARGLFEARGYEATTMRDIGAAMGMSTGAVFASFPDKAAIYREVHGHPPVTPELGRELMMLGVLLLLGGMSPATRGKMISAVQRCGYDLELGEGGA